MKVKANNKAKVEEMPKSDKTKATAAAMRRQKRGEL